MGAREKARRLLLSAPCAALMGLMGLLTLCAVGAEAQIEPGPFLRLETGGHTANVWDICFSPDGAELFAAGTDKVVRVWDARSGELRRTLRVPIGPGPQGRLYTVDISPDGRWAATAGYGVGESVPIYILDTRTGEIAGLGLGHENVVFTLAFSADGKELASGGADRAIRIWRIDEAGRLSLRDTLEGHEHTVYDLSWFPSDAGRLVSASFDGTLRIWRRRRGAWKTRDILRGHKGEVRSVAVSPDGRLIASGSYDNTIRLWDGGNGDFLRVLGIQDSDVVALAFSADGRTIASTTGADGGRIKAVHLWSVLAEAPPRAYTAHDNAVFDVAWSPAEPGRLASAGGSRSTIYLWDSASLRTGQTLEGHGRPIWALATASDRLAWGNTLEYRSINRRGPLEKVLDLNSLEPMSRRPDPAAFNRALVERPERRLVAPQWHKGWLEIRTVAGGLYKFRSPHNYDEVRSYTFLSHRKIAVGTSFGLYQVDAMTGDLLGEYVGHEGEVWAVAPYDGGRILISGSKDQTIRFWDAESRDLLLSFYHDTTGQWVTWTPQGYYKASSGGARLIGWHLNKGSDVAPEFFSADQLRASLNRPDIIERVLKGGSVERAVVAANAARNEGAEPDALNPIGQMDAILPPRVKILQPAAGTVFTRPKITVRLKVEKGPSGRPIEEVRLLIDGRPVTSDTGAGARLSATVGMANTYEIELKAGRNTISALARNATALSEPATVEVEYRPR